MSLYTSSSSYGTDYVLGDERVSLSLKRNYSRDLAGEATLSFFFSTNAKDARVKLNAANLRIHKIEIKGASDVSPWVQIDDYQYFNYFDSIVAESAKAQLKVGNLKKYYCHYRAKIEGANDGELIIPVAKQLKQEIEKGKGSGVPDVNKNYRKLFLRITYTIISAKAGLRFVDWDKKGFASRRAYLYTRDAACGSGAVLCGGAGARSLFPCIDRPGQATKFSMNFTVPYVGMKVVCTGFLAEVRGGSHQKSQKRFNFILQETPAHSIGFAIGYLELVQADPHSNSFPCYCPIDFKESLEYLIGHSTSKKANDSRQRSAVSNVICARSAIDFISLHLGQQYPGQTNFGLKHKDRQEQDIYRSKYERFLVNDRDEQNPANSSITHQRNKPPEYIIHVQIFVHGLEITENFHSPAIALTNVKSFANMIFIPGELLPAPGAPLVDIRLRYAVTNGVAAQWFGCWIDVASWTDAWIQAGMIGYLTFLFLRQKNLRPPLPDSTAMERLWCELNDAICDEELDPRRKQHVRALAPMNNQFWLCEPFVVGSSEFVALKAPFVVHVLDTRDSVSTYYRSQWLKQVGSKKILSKRVIRRFNRQFLTPQHSGDVSGSAAVQSSTDVSIVPSAYYYSGLSGTTANVSGTTDVTDAHNETDQIQTPMLDTNTLIDKMPRTLKRMVRQPYAVHQLRVIFYV